MKVLIADDDPEIQKMLSIGLHALGHEVISARDAMQAFMYAKQRGPDIVLLDINMPGGNGLEVLKLLKGAKPTKHIPVVIISASADPEMPEKVKGMGALEYLGKPLDIPKIQEILNEASRQTSPQGKTS